MRAGHRRVCAGFINEHKARKVEISLAGRPELSGQGHIRVPLLRHAPGMEPFVALLRRIDRFFKRKPTPSPAALVPPHQAICA